MGRAIASNDRTEVDDEAERRAGLGLSGPQGCEGRGDAGRGGVVVPPVGEDGIAEVVIDGAAVLLDRVTACAHPIANEMGEMVGKNYLTPNALTEKEQALALIAELRAHGIEVAPDPVRADLSGPYSVRYDPEETRKVYNVVISGGQQNAGLLLQTRNQQGMGAPGRWIAAAIGNGVIWQAAPVETGELDARPRVERPMRELYANESYRVNGFSVGVKRTDKNETALLDLQTNLAYNVAEILKLVRGLVAR